MLPLSPPPLGYKMKCNNCGHKMRHHWIIMPPKYLCRMYGGFPLADDDKDDEDNKIKCPKCGGTMKIQKPRFYESIANSLIKTLHHRF